MVNLIYAEINAFGIFVLLLMLVSIKRNLTVQYGEELFIALIISLTAMLIIDASTSLINGVVQPNLHISLIIVNTLYYFQLGIVGFCWLLFFDFRINGKGINYKRRTILYAVPCAAISLVSIINIFTGWIFYINEDNYYIRGSSFFIYSASAWLIMLIPAVMTVSQGIRESLSYRRSECFIEALYILPPLLGWILQYAFNLVSLVWIMAVASLLINFIDMQSRQISLDALTGVNNRRTFNRYLESFVDNPKQKESLALFIIDVNDFKNINDSYGHMVGDDVLIKFAASLKRVCGYYNCFLARYGGDEFAVICSDLNDSQLDMIEEKIKQEVFIENCDDGIKYTLSCSIGRSRLTSFTASDIDNMIVEADRNMYRNKGLYKVSKTYFQNK